MVKRVRFATVLRERLLLLNAHKKTKMTAVRATVNGIKPYVKQVLFLVIHAPLNVRKWACIKHVNAHNSQNVKFKDTHTLRVLGDRLVVGLRTLTPST